MSDPYHLARFVEAQDPVIDRVLQELQAGRKASHWMWFVFPQLDGLGRSAMAERYALSGVDEARAYLRHPVLGPRLEACVNALMQHCDKSARQILGSPDDLKLRSCLTLFAQVDPSNPLFQLALVQFYQGEPDALTLGLLGQ
ncbi:DUF1810 domain-containing protein [Pseudomonas guariconensis]|uniref:DUF1810 domain-containing protein n=1 Tax=Pseudomonas TaxID=286 RepID=UPI001CE3D3DD|nr:MULTISPECIES: DUF1810 domain-containing protein [Pseudomonas]MCO7641673.1 DUF1810 domain-containing protein [Pseudomonas sp. S 311-6]MCO7517120.1 DUF1810 domain-containing protein [Pseudomonas putida]MCO7567142.1 DUF1810 domain-containing protein [Pseudomonas mosselii]MCO7596352.1 DUF1810 domain-containing protein [Pseudomonas guariconensis]MCO7607436.1 DUF1810 domain-containing protein [Pseudomonas guariconensis]